MNKSIIAAAVALLGVAVHGATAQWDVDTVYAMGSSSAATGYLAYFVDADKVSTSAATAYIAAGNFDFLSDSSQAWAALYTSDDGYLEGSSGDVFGNGVDVTGYLVIFNGATTGGATHAYVSTTDTAQTTGLGGPAVFSFDDTQLAAMQSASNWTAAAPEPTSGLLLLLGMAGLALRRKRA